MKSKGQIIEIKEVSGVTIGKSSATYDGYRVELDTGIVIQLLIDNRQNCCETWGYLYTPDPISTFLFADVYSWEDKTTPIAVDAVANELDISNKIVPSTAQFITFNTSVGELTFAVYNVHNGFYSHGAKLIINGEVEDEWYL